jgi:hypothetical protein
MAQGRCTGQLPMVFMPFGKRGLVLVLLPPDIFFGHPYSGAHFKFFVRALKVTMLSREVGRKWGAPATALRG